MHNNGMKFTNFRTLWEHNNIPSAKSKIRYNYFTESVYARSVFFVSLKLVRLLVRLLVRSLVRSDEAAPLR